MCIRDRHDLDRNAQLFQVPLLDTPSNFLSEVARNIIAAQRLICAAQVQGFSTERVVRLIWSITHAVHLDKTRRGPDNTLTVDQGLLVNSCEQAGFSAEETAQLLAGSQAADAKGLLKQNTQHALSLGAFGSPTMRVHPDSGGSPFLVFGSDRFEQIAFMCGKEWRGSGWPAAGTAKL
eukprot:TRINITY_DN18792_c0_g1_i3.p1 TRINITY_DN18792_c0_g1~~TRINITY_DN18792_c0_g1_i3.p1  ORF type:complete len:178 (-),score=42.27 TRINITY_DN18792_c0_g1_i3:115-648(-)